MKAFVALIIMVGFWSNTLTGYCQNQPASKDMYRITLVNGKKVKTKDFMRNANVLYFSRYNATTGFDEYVEYNVSEIQKIEASTSTKTLPGFLIGTGAGVVAMVITEIVVEKPKTSTITVAGDGYTRTITTTTTKEMATGAKVGIVAGGSLLGTIIGASIKSGWKIIFPTSTTFLEKIDLHIANSSANYNSIGLSYRF